MNKEGKINQVIKNICLITDRLQFQPKSITTRSNRWAFLLFFNSPRGKFKLSDEAHNNSEKVVILGDSLVMHQLRQK